MSHRKHGLKLLGLLAIAALGVLAFASAAQAVAVPEFLIAKKTFLKELDATVGGEQEKETLSYLLVAALNLEIKCPEFEVLKGLFLTSLDADARLLYKECKAFEMKAPLAELPCHVSDVGGGKPEKLHITTSEVLILPLEFHPNNIEKRDFGILIHVPEFFINFLANTGCPLPLKNKISGQVCGLIEPTTNDTVRPLVLFSQAIQELEPCKLEATGVKDDKLLYGVNEAFIDASVEIFLTGEKHKGLTLGVSLA